MTNMNTDTRFLTDFDEIRANREMTPPCQYCPNPVTGNCFDITLDRYVDVCDDHKYPLYIEDHIDLVLAEGWVELAPEPAMCVRCSRSIGDDKGTSTWTEHRRFENPNATPLEGIKSFCTECGMLTWPMPADGVPVKPSPGLRHIKRLVDRDSFTGQRIYRCSCGKTHYAERR